ncbi:MAG TPA: hypothetical protein PJ991_12835 [Kiritimatiellia bacterium]|nr:hypothetical protein [Kiritimatiellia bacterium]
MKLPENDEVQQALRPIASLISKSEKAQQKVAPGTWQHAMLRDNLNALHIASELMTKTTDDTDRWTRDDLHAVLQAFVSMIGKTEKARARFSPGTSQHTLQRNRLKALRIAKELIQMESDRR